MLVPCVDFNGEAGHPGKVDAQFGQALTAAPPRSDQESVPPKLLYSPMYPAHVLYGIPVNSQWAIMNSHFCKRTPMRKNADEEDLKNCACRGVRGYVSMHLRVRVDMHACSVDTSVCVHACANPHMCVHTSARPKRSHTWGLSSQNVNLGDADTSTNKSGPWQPWGTFAFHGKSREKRGRYVLEENQT